LYAEKYQFFPPLHGAGDFAHADFRLRATFTVKFATLAKLKSMVYIHKNNLQYIGYKEPALKTM
jgi:hypothetical protein